MEFWLSLLLPVLVAGIILIAFVPVVRYLWTNRQQARASVRPMASRKPTIIEGEVQEVPETPPPSAATARPAEPAPRPARPAQTNQPTSQPGPRLPHLPRSLLIGGPVVVVLLLGGLLLWPTVQTWWLTDQFVVLIASFEDGRDGSTGAVVANELADVLAQTSEDRLVVRRLERVPADEAAVLAAAAENVADVVIWGEVQAGALLDSSSLQPRLTYAPTGADGPRAWAGYTGRFSMPQTYALATAPINGRVVLPPLLLALADYSSGAADEAYTALGSLLADYPLDPTLPRALRGNVLWARGAYQQAAAEYRQTLAQAGDHAAPLANNLAAILIDADDAGAADALNDAIARLQGQDLGALRFNLGRLALRQQRLDAATVELEQARRLLPANTPLLLALTNVYRETGQLAAADATMRAAEVQVGNDASRVPATMRGAWEGYQRAVLLEERGLLALARQIDTAGPLLWELEQIPPQPVEALSFVEGQLRNALDNSHEAAAWWRRRATADAAARELASQIAEPETGLVASGQAQRIEENLDRQRFHLALVLIEEGRAYQIQESNFFADLLRFFGIGDRFGEARTLLSEMEVTSADDVPILVADARVLRLRNPPDLTASNTRYDQAITIAPGRAEPYYGKSMVALANGDRVAASQLLDQALQQNADFFPARLQLARFAEEAGDWDTALNHLRALVRQHPHSAAAALQLASALRRSGPANYSEAEQVLLPIVDEEAASSATPTASETTGAALIELGRIYRDSGQTEQAIAAFERARTSDTHAPAAGLELGRLLVQQGDVARAEALFQDVIDRGQTSDLAPQARLELAELYDGPLNRPDDANYHYERVLAAGVQDLGVLLMIGDRMLADGKTPQALEAFRRADTLQPNDAGIAHRLALAYRAQGNIAEASTQERRALELVSNEDTLLRGAILAGLGDIERLSGNFPNANEFYNQALATDPAQIDAALGMGLIAVAQNNWAVALGHFERAVGFPTGQENPTARFWYAEALLRQDGPGRAIPQYEQALALQPTYPAALLGLAQAQYYQGQHDQAYQSLERALQQNPNYAEALLFQGRLLYERGDVAQAATIYSRAIELNDRLAEAYYRRGLIMVQQALPEEGVRDLQRAVELSPNDAQAHYWLGRANFALDRTNAALAAFERAIQLRSANGASYPEAQFYQALAQEALGQIDAAMASFQNVVQTAEDSGLVSRAQSELERIGLRQP